MAQIIIFGGGDAGGIIITPNGVRRIPPFDPPILLQLRGVSALAQATLYQNIRRPDQEFSSLVNKLTNFVVGKVEAVVGPLDGENSLVFQDEDGGFTCGSTGKPPIPFPKKGPQVPHLSEVLSRRVMSPEVLELADAANKNNVPLKELFADPMSVARKLAIPLDERSARDLAQLSPSNISKIADPVSRECAAFFSRVIDDGRYIGEFAREPARIAKDLDIRLSDAAIDRIVAGGSLMHDHDPGLVMNPVAIAVAVGIVIMLVDDVAMVGIDNVIDTSGIQKL